MKYERLTHQKYDENIDLTQEYGYSYIYKRLYELEDKIEADTAEYAGQKNAAIALQGLASTNGWTVVTYKTPDGASINKLLKSDGEVVTQAELEVGVKNYLEKLKNDKWDGKLPVYYLGSDGSVTTVIPTPTPGN